MAFRKITLVVEVLCNGPFEWDNLGDVNYAITRGSCSGFVDEVSDEIISKEQLIAECEKHHTDPSYFLEGA